MVRSVKGRRTKEEENMENGEELKVEDTEKKEEDESSAKTDVPYKRETSKRGKQSGGNFKKKTKSSDKEIEKKDEDYEESKTEDTEKKEEDDSSAKTDVPYKRETSKRGKQSGGNFKKKTKSSDKEIEKKDEDYEVERVVNMNEKKNGKREFLIRWKGYSAKDDTWEPEEHLECQDLINAFLNTQGAQQNGSSKTTRKGGVKSKEKETTNYEVEKVVDFNEKNGKRMFLIRWKGYKAKDDTWEPEANLSCEKLIEEYLVKNKGPVKITKSGRTVKSRKQLS